MTKYTTEVVSKKLPNYKIEVQGSLTFPFDEFGMSAPNIAGFVSVQDSATLEIDLHFANIVPLTNTQSDRLNSALQSCQRRGTPVKMDLSSMVSSDFTASALARLWVLSMRRASMT